VKGLLKQYLPYQSYREGYQMIEPLLGELAEALDSHDRTVKVGFMFYELLNKAGYDDEEISEVANAMIDIVN
jgi:hypothetical protein